MIGERVRKSGGASLSACYSAPVSAATEVKEHEVSGLCITMGAFGDAIDVSSHRINDIS